MRILLLASLPACLLICTFTSAEITMSDATANNDRPIIGAIRWDAWHGDQGGPKAPRKSVEHALGPAKYHFRLPWYAVIRGEDDVSIDGATQEIVDQEIEHSHDAGIDYWAFVTYDEKSPMSLALHRYLASDKREKVKFCMLTEHSKWRMEGHGQRMIRLMQEPTYLTVLDDRPLLFIGFIDPQKIEEVWGGAEGFAQVLDDFRDQAVAAGLKRPYIVIMDFSPTMGHHWRKRFECDAISSYATTAGHSHGTYAQLAQHTHEFWDQSRATGSQVVPIVMSGWDRRPRIERPVPWETGWQKPGENFDRYYETATPVELATHMRDALKWMNDHRQSTQARLAIVYAWNENDEGGWLMPTVGEGTSRLDELRKVLRPAEATSGGTVHAKDH